MYVSAIEVEGLRGAPRFAAQGWGRVVTLPAGAEGVALADAFTLLAGSLDAGRTRDALTALGLLHPGDDPDLLEEDRVPFQVRLADAAASTCFADLERQRQVTVRATFVPDPPFFGRLRDLAVREPRLVTALGGDPDLTVKVGWMWSLDLAVVAIAHHEVSIGGVAFPGSGTERPPWLAALLRDLAARVWRVDPREPVEAVTERLYEASLAHEPASRARYRRAVGALAAAPLALGELGWVRSGGRAVARFGDALAPPRQLGIGADEAIRLVEAVHVRAPDVLVVESPGLLQADPSAARAWLKAATEGDDATLEQVILLGGGAP